ncbi:RdgB/HAM1 family non-canonical purine NTP pyrophosphatase [Trueperella pyogenes]|uniref:dITP/XTP pyrophosphatase n=1 Tax=Trueperella pyogenes TaxID=1661 RepID=A0A380M879_9ACTO|nr:RdgB/HAM1 family non-canonical purine NTP pyrophosphatase [Trueperella pyogenes]AWG04411.1 non-canonical purine NTP pyrophosphatase, RdgB/HAM1 family [Trueperella pyogenes]AWG17138.1 non-canonical purine NTP pyrophosphatase, RdgB/HAM1 family [Trueperella pyogenes]AZR04127.1 RdgB/HAM1 family non-canonical purine NTP pyrophosphatase [Trueperella pyogenes]AZR06309.1 RdgB/HAM1 family non-canonical purine NTP pyrophosphatase [Trueperella pyogenes]MBB3024374.1 XTP/dITP diphosphohydrolase [Trueper
MIILATRNAHKVEEVRNILAPLLPSVPSISPVPAQLPEPVEDGATFAENAIIKANQVARELGVPAIADDSGLCVDILGGAPGIFSARWSGTHGDDAANLDLLLAQLADVKHAQRGARFVCAAALALPDGTVVVEEGHMAGQLRYERAGEGGFGYDPIFQPEGYDVTNAQLSPADKNAISHRGKAFAALAPHIAQLLN